MFGRATITLFFFGSVWQTKLADVSFLAHVNRIMSSDQNCSMRWYDTTTRDI